jgi:hypothetical protein
MGHAQTTSQPQPSEEEEANTLGEQKSIVADPWRGLIPSLALAQFIVIERASEATLARSYCVESHEVSDCFS